MTVKLILCCGPGHYSLEMGSVDFSDGCRLFKQQHLILEGLGCAGDSHEPEHLCELLFQETINWKFFREIRNYWRF
jgi:hypothetical protein